MTGTAMTEKQEFHNVYGMDVIAIQTNRPVICADHEDSLVNMLFWFYFLIVKKDLPRVGIYTVRFRLPAMIIYQQGLEMLALYTNGESGLLFPTNVMLVIVTAFALFATIRIEAELQEDENAFAGNWVGISRHCREKNGSYVPIQNY